jgi:uncharacterized protein YjhX (UPF0386 family)
VRTYADIAAVATIAALAALAATATIAVVNEIKIKRIIHNLDHRLYKYTENGLYHTRPY